MGRAWLENCELEAARLASRVHGKRYRGMVVSVYEMEMKAFRKRVSRRQQCQLRCVETKNLETRIRRHR